MFIRSAARQWQGRTVRGLSTSTNLNASHSCKLLVVGGGAGGCTIASKFASRLGRDQVIVLEPGDFNYYQPMFTMIGGGMKSVAQSRKPMGFVLPKNATWLKDAAGEFSAKDNQVVTAKGDVIKYEYLVCAVGLQLNYHKIPGLIDALKLDKSGVCSNYSPDYVTRTYQALCEFNSGNAIFTFPNTPVKCPGAPQKAAYISEDYLRKNAKRSSAKVFYNTSLPVIFGVKKYADALWKVVESRDIDVNLKTNLIGIEPGKRIATFANVETNEKLEMPYEMLHVTPPMSTPDALAKSALANSAGFVEVDKDTLQSTRFPNVFAIGDCSSSPNSKTAAAVAAQSSVVTHNLNNVMSGGKQSSQVYNGYASCPLVTGYSKCILAEFDYNLNPLETFPFNQAKELRSMFFMKKEMMPTIYWLMLKGYWGGPALMRKLAHFGFA